MHIHLFCLFPVISIHSCFPLNVHPYFWSSERDGDDAPFASMLCRSGMELPKLNWRSVYANRLLLTETANSVRISSYGSPTSRSFLAWGFLVSNRSIFQVNTRSPVDVHRRQPGKAIRSSAVIKNQDDSVIESSVDDALQYVPLHVHSDFSLLDGASQVSCNTDYGCYHNGLFMIRRDKIFRFPCM